MATTFPSSIQTFTTMLNVTASDGAAITGYQAAMQAGNAALAQQYYNQITNANQKFINATTLNTLIDTCSALQSFYLTDIQPYITTKQSEWQNIINEFSYLGVYNPSTQYAQNNFVLYNYNAINYIYLCIATPPTSGIVPTDAAYWRQLTIRGKKGDSGTGLAFLYAWNGATDYTLQDLVSYNNALWGCIQANSNQPPYSGSSYWQLVGEITQTIYPLQSTAPISQATGELWFQTL